MVVNKKNPFAFKAKQAGKKKSSGKRVGKSRPEKANNQLNRKRLGITVFQPRLKVCTFARTNYYEYGKQRQVQESP